jgi:hypothetical protein
MTLFEMRDGRSITPEEIPDDDHIIQAMRCITTSKNIVLQSGPEPDPGNAPVVEYEEGTLPGLRWTHICLRKLPCWDIWKRSETTQLESMKNDGMYGPPCITPRGAIVLHTVWTYYVKWGGTLKSRSCCDGSVLKGSGISFAQHYTACISQPGMNILWPIVAIHGWVAVGTDAINAFFPIGPSPGTHVRAHG